MRSKTGTFFDCKVRYPKTLDDGLQKLVTEAYVVDAVSWAEAEARVTAQMVALSIGEFEITDIKKAAYKEIFANDSPNADAWYKARVQFITLDEKTNREKKSNACYLVQASNIESAKRNFDEVFGQTMIDYKIAKLEETCIMEVFTHN